MYLQAEASRVHKKGEFMDNKLTNEQIAHDLAIAYVTYTFTTSNETKDVEPFYQEYENAYPVFLNLVKRNN